LRSFHWFALAQWSDSEDRESQDKQHQEDEQENIEKDSCDIGRCDGDIRKAQQARDDRHQEKNERPSENSHFDVLQCDADLTIVRSHWFRSHQAGPFDILTSVKESIGISRYVSRVRRTVENPMCDYSLHAVASRPAKVGERLVSTGFYGISTRGFAAKEELGVAVCLLARTELAFEHAVKGQCVFVSIQEKLKDTKPAMFGNLSSFNHEAAVA
jgi:hypothetical protein